MQDLDLQEATQRPVPGFNDRALAHYAIAVLAPAVPLVILPRSGYGTPSQQAPLELLLWIAALVLVNLLEVSTRRGQALVAAEPLALAMCILFPPPVACLLALIGSCNPHELRSVSDLVRGASNRAQTALG